MKTIVLAFAALAILAAGCTKAPDSQQAEAGDEKSAAAGEGVSYTLNTQESKLAWVGTKVTGYHHGVFPINRGALVFNGETITGGEFEVNVAEVKVLDEGMAEAMIGKLTTHLQSDDFFKVKEFPTATFVITSVSTEATDSTTHRIEGNLTLRGVTKNISFGAKVTPEGENLKAHAVFNIDRQQWGVSYKGKQDDLIRDEVNLTVDLVAAKAAAETASAETSE